MNNMSDLQTLTSKLWAMANELRGNMDALSFENGLAVVSKDGLYGFINHRGNIVISCQFENARNFSEGLAPVTNAKGFWGYIDKNGNWVIKAQYDYADSFVNEEARIIKGSKVFYINKDNKIIRE